MQFCPNCGSQREGDANYCTNCGYEFDSENVSKEIKDTKTTYFNWLIKSFKNPGSFIEAKKWYGIVSMIIFSFLISVIYYSFTTMSIEAYRPKDSWFSDSNWIYIILMELGEFGLILVLAIILKSVVYGVYRLLYKTEKSIFQFNNYVEQRTIRIQALLTIAVLLGIIAFLTKQYMLSLISAGILSFVAIIWALLSNIWLYFKDARTKYNRLLTILAAIALCTLIIFAIGYVVSDIYVSYIAGH